ncbi:MAG: hypothetical protein ACK5RO_09845 [Pseudobdellovibrionaceae bacterium]|jgi:hypothetical protein
MLKFIERLKTQHLVAIFVLSSVLSAVLYFAKNKSTSESDAAVEAEVTDASTFIPAGYVLVPIELSNQASLQSLIGAYAVVDLFIPGSAGQPRGRRVGKNLRLIRAPLNPDQFAVLVRDHEVAAIMESQLPLFAVIQNSHNQSESQVSGQGSTESVTYFEGN